MEFGLATGLRGGELLSLRKSDLDLPGLTYEIRRRPDAEDDPRSKQPLVKGRGRTLGMTQRSATLLSDYLSLRDRMPAAERHDFVFISERGDPLSESSVNKMVGTIRDGVPCIDENFTLHTLRYD